MSINLFQIFSRLFSFRPRKKHAIISARNLTKTQNKHLRRILTVELLEGRVVPAAPLVSSVLAGAGGFAVSGTVYEDLNSDGVKNNGENGVSGWTVYLDLNQSGTLNQDAVGDWEPSAVTNVDGDYAINHLKPGTYRFSEVLQTGWTPTSPASQDVVVTGDTDKVDFFNFSGGDIAGTVWNDLDGNGERATDPVSGAFTEPGLASWTVFLDFDNSGAVDPGEPSSLTDAEGHYSFTNLPPDDYEVTVLLPDGWEASPGFDNRQTAGVVARDVFRQDFANFSVSNGSIQGTIWNDVNANGFRDTDLATGEFTEPGLADWTVFLDLNEDGIADAGEPTTLTNAAGEYAFISLPAGTYEVTQVLPEGWYTASTFDINQSVEVLGGEVSVARDFANFTVLNGSIRGTVWNDLNRNGSRDVNIGGTFTDPGLAGWTVYLDLNNDRVADASEPIALTDVNGQYSFTDLQVGDYEIRQVLPSGWEATTGYGDSVGVTVYSGAESVAPDFANFNLATAIPGSVSGVVWNDLNGNGIRDVVPGSGVFTDPGLAGWTVFADLNTNGILDATDPSTTSAPDGSYTLAGILPGSVTVIEQANAGWRPTAPTTARRTIALRNGESATGLDFGNWALQDSTIRGVVFADTNKNGVRDAGERGLDSITVYLDLNNNGDLDTAEPQTGTSGDLYFTPTVDEAGSYSFTHLAAGTYTVRAILPAILSATPAAELQHVVTLVGAESRNGVDTAAVFRPTEIHGVKFEDTDGDHVRDESEHGVGGVTVFVDLDRDNSLDAGEPTALSADDGSYSFTGLAPGAYVVREVLSPGYEATYPTTTGGIFWPQGASNPAVGNVTPTSITTSMGVGESYRQSVSITLPNTGALTNLVDVFLLFDDTGSFVNNSPIVRSAFPTIISQLQSSLPGIDLGFGVGRFEEYGNFASEYATGRPFILNQPIVAASTTGYLAAIQAALNRTTPGYGGDGPETDIEALYQLVTGLGFDGNNNGTVLDSGAAGLASTQLNPGSSGDVPSFASFQADAAGGILAAAGTVGGGGFRAGALPIILVATDIGFAFQPRGETTVTGVGGLTLPTSALTQTSRSTTPFNSGADLQQTITGLNALGALVIGLGTNPQANIDPRQGLEALSQLTGAVNRSTATIANGTADPIAPGDPLYFQIASGFASSVANGVVTAIQNAVTNVAVDITIQASDPRVRIINHTGVLNGIGSGQTASFDIEFVGDGIPRRFDLQFVRNGTNVVLGSIPVVIGTPIPGDCYEFEDLAEGEIHHSVDFGSRLTTTTSIASTTTVSHAGGFYNGSPFPATSSVTSADGLSTTASSLHYINTDTSADLGGSAPSDAGHYTVTAIYDGDANHTGSTSDAVAFTISQADSTTTVSAAGGIYNGSPFPATSSVTGAGGLNTTASSLHYFNTDTSTDLFGIAPSDAGHYTVTATYDGDANHTGSTSDAVAFTISQATPVITNLNTPVILAGTSSTTITGHLAAGLLFPTGDSVTGTLNGVKQSATVDASGDFMLTFETKTLSVGTYPIAVAYAGNATNFNASLDSNTTLTVNAIAQTIDVNGLNISAIAGAPLTRTVATFTNTLGSASSYVAVVSWGDGSTSFGEISGVGDTLSVVGTHTYADPGTAKIQVTIVDILGLGLSATATSVATVKNLGLAAGKIKGAKFWHTPAGQDLISRFNFGGSHTELANWLAVNFPNLYGANAGVSNLTGKPNTDVAAYFQLLWRTDHDGAATEVLATALNVYATTASLGGNEAASLGFRVSATGLGARTFKIGNEGAAVEAANRARLNVFELLRRVDRQAVNGILYNGNDRLQHLAEKLFGELSDG